MSIDCFNVTTAHLYGDALASQFRLRHQVFIERVDYQVPSWKGMEYDQFDTPATQYFVWRDENGVARGIARLAPTCVNYMLKEIWPDKITKIDMPQSERVWEGTRFGVDHSLPAAQRNAIVKELVCGYMEYAAAHGIDDIIGVMPVGIWRAVFARNGWPPVELGPVWREDGIEVQAARLPVTMETLQSVRHRTKVSNVLQLLGEHLDQAREAA
ncbi:MAG: GNAT family N-acetyltransferase [Rhodospirillales bacterium]|nr:GNAT family N-acetyltransferase [Rhodospirillales bacterium]